MNSPGHVILDPSPPAKPPRRGAGLAAAMAGAMIGTLLVVGAFRGSGSSSPDTTIPQPGPDLLERARLAVEELAFAWNAGDVAVVDTLIAPDWVSVTLPGFTDPRFEPAGGRTALTDGIAFLSGVGTLTLGACDPEIPPPDSVATAIVRCDDARFEGRYLDAVRRNTWQEVAPAVTSGAGPRRGGITFGIRGDRVVSIDVAGARDFTPQAYCIWAERARPDLASSLFDLHCRPTTTPTEAAAHAALATAFVDAGAPLPSHRLAEARLAALYVDRLVEHINLDDTHTPLGWLAATVSPAQLPGFAGAIAEPSLADYLAWAARVLEIVIGECTVELQYRHTIVTCPEMGIAGPIVDGVLPQPTRFTLRSDNASRAVARAYARIVDVEALGDEALRIDDVCRRLQRDDPAAAARAFTGDCLPVYTKEAADVLRSALEQS